MFIDLFETLVVSLLHFAFVTPKKKKKKKRAFTCVELIHSSFRRFPLFMRLLSYTHTLH
jgi:hypothetical protein